MCLVLPFLCSGFWRGRSFSEHTRLSVNQASNEDIEVQRQLYNPLVRTVTQHSPGWR